MNKNKRIYIANLNHSTKVNDLYNLFSSFGNVINIKIFENKNIALVEMENYQDAENAKNFLNNRIYSGRELIVFELIVYVSWIDKFVNYLKKIIQVKQTKMLKDDYFSENGIEHIEKEQLGELLSEYGHVNHLKTLYRDNLYFKNLNF